MRQLETQCDQTSDDVPDNTRRRARARTTREVPAPRPSREACSLYHAAATAWGERYGLTPAQSTVLAGTLLGMDRAALAADLKIRPGTLGRHVKNMLAKTGDASLDDSLVRALREIIERLLAHD